MSFILIIRRDTLCKARETGVQGELSSLVLTFEPPAARKSFFVSYLCAELFVVD